MAKSKKQKTNATTNVSAETEQNNPPLGQALDEIIYPVKTNHERYSVAEICDALRHSHGLITLAADFLKCDDQTIYNYRAKYPEFINPVIEHYRMRRVDSAEYRLDRAITEGQPWAIALTLRTIGKDRGYVEKGQPEIPIEVKTYISVSPEDWDNENPEDTPDDKSTDSKKE